MKPIRVNAAADVTIHEICGGERCAVVDGFLDHPAALVDFACERADEFEPQDIGYPGVLLDVGDDLMADIYRFVRYTLSGHFGFFKGGLRAVTYLSMATRQPSALAPLQRLPHSDPRKRPDRRNYAGLLYLFDDEQLGGTGFYRWKERELIEHATALELDHPGGSLEFLEERFAMFREAPRYMSGSNDVAELLLEIPPRFNRFIFYSGDLPHSAHIPQPELLSGDFAKGRLTLNCFASVRPRH